MTDYRTDEDAYFQINMWNVNIFKKEKDASSLIDSVEWYHVDYPVKNLTFAPGCIKISASREKKELGFCFENQAKVN
jgi:hypothetical protein